MRPLKEDIILASAVRTYRVFKNYTQSYMAEKLGISESTYNRTENGYRSFSAGQLLLITDLLQVKLHRLKALIEFGKYEGLESVPLERARKIYTEVTNGSEIAHSCDTELDFSLIISIREAISKWKYLAPISILKTLNVG